MIEKTLNELAYNFSLWRPLDFLAAMPTLDALAVRADATKVILFALLNQKVAYNCHHQLLFMKIDK